VLLTLSAYAVAVTSTALRHIGPKHFALLWDDALFFKRVGYNIVHHGFAGWNLSDGPLYMNTSQLFQLLAASLVGLFPNHYNAAVTLWGALALSASFALLARPKETGLVGLMFLFCLLQAPPIALSLTTGMETPTVILLMAAFLRSSTLDNHNPKPRLLGSWQLAVYLVRPDAILASFATSFIVLWRRERWRPVLTFSGYTAVLLAMWCTACWLYYGSAFPLSALLKVMPISSYDHNYLSTGLPNKLRNLAQTAVVALPLLPLVAARQDRKNLALVTGACLFVGFHALTTYEIAAYHARFYAPALPLLFAAALRGIPEVQTAKRAGGLVIWGVMCAFLTWIFYRQGWIENGRGYEANIVAPSEYARYLVGLPLLGLVLLSRSRSGRIRIHSESVAPLIGFPPTDTALTRLSSCIVVGLAGLQTASVWPGSWSVVSDSYSNAKTIESHSSDVGIEMIQRCFPEPFQLTHSEIGLPGVLFLESRIIDLSGLANPEIVHKTFDFDQLCERERPEFIFRPHPTYGALNAELDRSHCLAREYSPVPLPRRSNCPLLVRNDRLSRYLACADAPPN
jgi:hypothetical protein